MVVCRYFLQGTCKFGSSCRFEHASSDYGVSPLYNPQSNTAPKPTTPSVDTKILIKTVVNDMTLAEKGGQWILSSYAPLKDQPAFPGFEDHSFEEIRLAFIEATKSGTLEQYQKNLQMMLQQAMMKMKSLQNPSAEIVSMLKTVYCTPLSGATTKNQWPLSQHPQTFFANQTTNQPQSVFASNATGAFSGSAFANQNKSIFGSAPQNQSSSIFASPAPVFGAQPAFAAAQTNNPVFATTQASSVFATTQANGSVFSTPQTNNSVFGTVQASGSVFATPQANNSVFATQNQPNNSVFGQTNNPSTQVFQTSNNFKPQTPQSQGIFGNMGQQVLVGGATGGAPNPAFYSKREELTEAEIKWFESNDLDVCGIPDAPPTYEMCFPAR